MIDMQFSASGELFAAAPEDGMVFHGFKKFAGGRWDFNSSLFRTPHTSALSAVAYRGDTMLATADAEGLIKLWSLERGQLARDLERDRRR